MIPPEDNRTVRKSYRYLVVAHQTGSSLACSCSNCSHMAPPTQARGACAENVDDTESAMSAGIRGDSTGWRCLPPISVLCISTDVVNSHNRKSIMHRPSEHIPTPIFMRDDRAFVIAATKGGQRPSTTAILACIKNAVLRTQAQVESNSSSRGR